MKLRATLVMLLLCALAASAQSKPNPTELRQRRRQAVSRLQDGLLLVHAAEGLKWTADGFRQDPFFYYFTGLENTPDAILAIDAPSGESWLFVPDKMRFAPEMTPEIAPSTSPNNAGVEHVVPWSELENFLSSRATRSQPLYYISDPFTTAVFPTSLQPEGKYAPVPLWVVALSQKWSNFHPTDVFDEVHSLSAVESPTELSASRPAATSTVKAFKAGLAAIRPGVSQRSVENVVESACWDAGAHGSSFWPWVMTGPNAVFPRPLWSMYRYDHLDATLQSGQLVRFDIGCEWAHYGGDLGRTVPVSGKYTPEQREVWNALVAAYRTAAKTLREGTTDDQVFTAWRDELLRQRQSAKNDLTRRAIDRWVDRKNVPNWQLHTMTVDAGPVDGALRAGMVIDFEPIVSIDDLGFYLEDMFLITKDGAEDLTPGIPFTADEIETAMRKGTH